MRILFVHHSLPGQFSMLVRALAELHTHQIVFITQSGQGRASLPGVTVVPFLAAATSLRTHPDARAFDTAMRRAAAVADVARGLHSAGFVPDLVIGHEGWGDMLNLRDVWPGVPQIGLREYFYHESGADVGCDPEFPVTAAQNASVRARNAVGLLALMQGQAGVTPTLWQRALYPAWAQPGIHLVPDAVPLDRCRPDPDARRHPLQWRDVVIAPDEMLVTFVARDLEPYRGFHTFARTWPRLLARPGVRIVCLGGDSVSYGVPPPAGRWRDRLLAELQGRIDLSRLHFPGWVPHAEHVRLLQRSDIHAYLSYPFIASWSLREALACGCAVVAADTAPAREFVTEDRGVLVPPLDPGATADAILALMDDPDRRTRLGTAARGWAENRLQPHAHHEAWRSVIQMVSGLDPYG